MKLAIMQPYFLPYIGYFQLISSVEKFVVYDDVNFIKGGWINRNRILYNGLPKFITLSLKDKSSFKKINSIEISDDDTKKRIFDQIKNSYANAPYFKENIIILENIILNPEKNLSKYIYNSLHHLCEYLNITTEFIVSSNLDKDNTLKGKHKVISINKLLNSNVYINAIGGKELYSKAEFKKHNIALQFIKTGTITYKQFDYNFIPFLSIVDVLMFNPKDIVINMLQNYTLE